MAFISQRLALSLAIARQAVDAQGGRIHAESSGSSGCHFWIELPKRPSHESGTAADSDGTRAQNG